MKRHYFYTLFAVTVMAAAIALAGCSSKDDSNTNDRDPADVGGGSSGGVPGSSGPPVEPGDQTAQNAFMQTPAYGDHQWAMTNVSLSYLKKNASTNEVQTKWSVNCADTNVRVIGHYPRVELFMSPYNCGDAENHPLELSHLEAITGYLGYVAKHIPTPDEPGQFHLVFNDMNNTFLPFSSKESLNALIRGRSMYFDFLGVLKDDMTIAQSNFFVEVSFSPGPDGPRQIKVSFTEDSGVLRQSTDIEILGDLRPAN